MKNENYEYLRKNMADEAINALTNKPVVTYSSERVRLWSEICEEVKSLPCQPLKIGHSLKKFLERVSIPVKENDILIGRMVEESFTPEEEEAFRAKYITDEMNFDGLPKFFRDAGHQSFLWDNLIKMGLPALKARAEEKLAEHTEKENATECDFMRGAVMIYEAVIRFIERCAEEAEKHSLSSAAEACRDAVQGAPTTFYGALQLVWAIEFIFCAYISPNPTLAVGRLDLFVIDLYRKDVNSGKISADFAKLVIDEFFAKNNLIMGRGEHQISDRENSPNCTGWHRILCYDAPQYLMLSGTDPNSGEPVCNELTELMINSINPRYKNPVIVFRYTIDFAENHPEVWKTLIEKMRDSGSIMIYNDIAVCEMYKKFGESEKDAYSHEFFGCNWPTLPGKDAPTYAPFHDGFTRSVMPTVYGAVKKYFENFKEGDRLDREKMLETVYGDLKDAFRALYLEKAPKSNIPNPKMLNFYCAFASDPIEKAGYYFENINMIVPLGGICSSIDILSALDYLINEKNISAKRILDACDTNYENDRIIEALCKNAPKMGDGNEISAYYAREFTKTAVRACEDATYDRPSFLKLRFCGENDTWHIPRGGEIDATPDGRRSGDPICQNCQPSVGAAKNGITAMLSSLANIPFDNFASGALNITIQPSNFAGEAGLCNLANIISTYLEKGGLQVQLSSVDKDLLLDAQKNPDMYRDLMVRVTGYSAVFVDMCKTAQDDLISRNTF